MMLFKLSLKNIQKSFKDYAIYFFTLILGVSIFYVFNAIESQTIMMDISASTYEIIKLMTQMLNGVSVFVSLVLGLLVIYASQFLIKRRNKEFGVYLTLGMSKRKISMILFFETLFIGIISLVVGLMIGVGLSQLMSLLVSNMFEANMTKFAFIFSAKAFGKTVLYFSIMYLLVMIFNTFTVNKCRLIDLLYASKKSETVKMKNPILCIVVFIISACVLGRAYYMVTGGIEAMSYSSMMLVVMAMGAFGTFFLFWSLSGLLLKIFMSLKKTYYKGLNSFTLRQASSKINTAVISMTLISLMLFVTICVLSSALSIKNSMNANITELAPVDVELSKNYNVVSDQYHNYTVAQMEDSKVPIKETMDKLDFDMNAYFTDTVDLNLYATNELTLRDSLGNYITDAEAAYPALAYDDAEMIIRLSDYNKLAKLYNLEQLTLNDNQYAIAANFEASVELHNNALATKPSITLLGKSYEPKYEKCKMGFVDIASNRTNIGLFVVPDDAVNDSIRIKNIIVANYNTDTEKGKEEIEDKLVSLDTPETESMTVLNLSTRLLIVEGSTGLGALVTFIGLYLGIIFLISSAALLALKELSESSDNKERFQMIRKLGADEKMINRALFRQIGIFFLFPLLVAIIHSIFGIKFCNYILATFGNDQMLPSIVMTAAFLIVIYGGYFIITYLCSKNIIRE
ncbi:MAG: ABC transporter permease [Lachnospiraceae bacterium]|nr:ABC transporter permease [Lachnospiraceae bacterium]MDD3617650.1 ABC transporter permease [Lachnospiraceae bacterium]